MNHCDGIPVITSLPTTIDLLSWNMFSFPCVWWDFCWVHPRWLPFWLNKQSIFWKRSLKAFSNEVYNKNACRSISPSRSASWLVSTEFYRGRYDTHWSCPWLECKNHNGHILVHGQVMIASIMGTVSTSRVSMKKKTMIKPVSSVHK